MSLFDLRDTPLSVHEVTAAVQHAGAGGTALFIGTVRDENDGRTVSLLEYEAYPSMARSQMAAIGAEVAQEIPGVRLAAVHRIGKLGIGDIAIVCAASAPHRGEAFRACRALIDRIKERVTVWKREHGPDGPYWVGWQDARCVGHDERDHHGHDADGRTHGEHHHER